MSTVDWILVADRSRAVVLHALPNGIGPFPVLSSYLHAEGRLRSQDRDSDVWGRVQHPGGARSTVEPHEDRWHVEASRFAKELVGTLEHEFRNGRFERLVVIAPAPFLGVLRAEWPQLLRNCIIKEQVENLLGMPESERQKKLAEIMESVNESLV